MKDINKIIESLNPGEQNVMYNALQKRLDRSPEYTIRKNGAGYSIKPSDKYENLPFNELGNSSRIILLGNIRERISLYNNYYIATFIIPKGSEYYENLHGELVTGKYVKL